MDALELISLILNLVLGGSLVSTLSTLRATKSKATAEAKKAAAEARADELQNVEAAIKVWRELSEKMTEKYDHVSRELESLTTEVRRLKNSNNRIIKLLDKITPENLATTVAAIKEELDETT